MPVIQFLKLLSSMRAAIFLMLDVSGIVLIIISQSFFSGFSAHVLLLIGSTFLTIGISLPIAIDFQIAHNTEHFKIIKTCEATGIRSIFINRDIDVQAIEESMDIAAKQTKEMYFLGVALGRLLDPDYQHSAILYDKMRDSTIKCRIALLNPKSDAAARRNEIEIGSPTLDNIEKSLYTGVESLILSRIQRYAVEHVEYKENLKTSLKNKTNRIEDIQSEIKKFINLEIKMYDFDPILYILGFDGCQFIEQYNFGRPPSLVKPKGCIGRHVPLIQYDSHSESAQFFKFHFEYIWKYSKNFTDDTIQRALTAGGLESIIDSI